MHFSIEDRLLLHYFTLRVEGVKVIILICYKIFYLTFDVWRIIFNVLQMEHIGYGVPIGKFIMNNNQACCFTKIVIQLIVA